MPLVECGKEKGRVSEERESFFASLLSLSLRKSVALQSPASGMTVKRLCTDAQYTPLSAFPSTM